MVSTFLTPVISQASRLGVGLFEDTDPMELQPNASFEDVETIVRAVYRQILGNAYVMESERLSVPESQLKRGEISVREFVRRVAKSDLYRSRFFDNCPRYRAIELNFKHFLGRAPESYAEMSAHSAILDREGFDGEIDSYLDSDEYQAEYGEDTVPFYRGYKTQTGKSMVGFPHLFQLLRGACSSDKGTRQGTKPHLSEAIIKNKPETVIAPSGVWSYGNTTDIKKLLQVVLRPNVIPETAIRPGIIPTENYLALQRQCQEQAELLESLQQQLAELRPAAALEAAVENKWQTSEVVTQGVPGSPSAIATSNGSESYADLQQRSDRQKTAIASVQEQLADARRLASVGNARLNKWRGRVFNG